MALTKVIHRSLNLSSLAGIGIGKQAALSMYSRHFSGVKSMQVYYSLLISVWELNSIGAEYLVTDIRRGGLLSGLSSPTICDCLNLYRLLSFWCI